MKCLNDHLHNSSGDGLSAPRYTVCTLVNDREQYSRMVASFERQGFSETDTEYLFLDNTEVNVVDAFAAYNIFLDVGRSPYIILCHQDVELIDDGRPKLDALLEELDRRDPRWALAGNAGAASDGTSVIRITDPNGPDRKLGGPLPRRVVSLDENFIVAKRSCNLSVSHDMTGFHMYGADLCIIADILGLNAYVVDFHLHHKSSGRMDRSYFDAKHRLRRKYARAFRSRWTPLVTLSPVFVSGSPSLSFFARVVRKLTFWSKYNTLPPERRET